MLHNPTNVDIDRDGCIWVAEGVNYRMHFNRQPEGDRIMVLQDTDGDGKADKSWPFVQEKFLRAPLGVAVIGNKVVVFMAPDLVVYTDKDGDKKIDSAKGDTREVLLMGFNGRNHDHSLHSVTVGPDGKWYFSAGNCGIPTRTASPASATSSPATTTTSPPAACSACWRAGNCRKNIPIDSRSSFPAKQQFNSGHLENIVGFTDMTDFTGDPFLLATCHMGIEYNETGVYRVPFLEKSEALILLL